VSETDRVNIICMKWGTKYGADYVNILHHMVRRHLKRPFRFVCFTDDASGFEAGVESFPLPPCPGNDRKETEPWRKISLFSAPLADLSGPTLFLDLDIIIMDDIGPFFDLPGEFCIIENWTTMGQNIGNSSVFRFVANAHPQVFDTYNADPLAITAKYDNEQIYVSRELADKLIWWPAEWVKNFKYHCLPRGIRKLFCPSKIPAGVRIIAFPGYPNPHEASTRWVFAKKWWKPKLMRPARWVKDYWQ